MTRSSTSKAGRPDAEAASPAGAPRTGPGRAPTADTEQVRPTSWLPPLLAAAFGIFMSVLDQTLTGVATPTIQRDLGGNNVDIQWLTTSYRLGQAIMVPLALWLCRRYGLRRMYVLALAVYLVTSLLSTAAPTLPVLAAFRFAQGVPGALGAVVSIELLVSVLPAERRAIGQPLLLSLVLSSPGFSPTLGGFFVEYLNWRFVFLVSAPIALIGLLAAFTQLPDLPPEPPRRFDWGGWLCIATALVCLQLATSKGSDWGWSSYVILILFAGCLDALILFVLIERQVREPLLNLRVFASQPYVLGCLLVVTVVSSWFAVPTYLPQYLQQVQGMTPFGSGLALLPQAASLLVGAGVAGLLASKAGPRVPMVAGLLVLGAGSLYLNRLSEVDLPRSWLVVVLTVRAFGVGLATVPVIGSMISGLPPALVPDGLAFRTMVQLAGPGVITLFLTAHQSHRQKQILVDRAQLLSPSDAPMLHAMARTDPSALLPQFQQQQYYDLAESYSEVFQIIGVAVLAAVVLALVGRWGERLPAGATSRTAGPSVATRRPWTRFTRVGLAFWTVLVLGQVAAFAGTYVLYTRHYVVVDNAQVDGRSIDITAPISGTLMRWDVDVGSRLEPDQPIGRIRPDDVTVRPGYVVRAPGRGTVASNVAVRGQYVAAGTTLAIAYDLADGYITARVSEDRIRDVQVGAPVDIVVDSRPHAGLTGVVTDIQSSSAGSFTVYPSPDQSTQNPQKVTQYVPVRIRYADTGAFLAPGMNVTVNIHKD